MPGREEHNHHHALRIIDNLHLLCLLIDIDFVVDYFPCLSPSFDRTVDPIKHILSVKNYEDVSFHQEVEDLLKLIAINPELTDKLLDYLVNAGIEERKKGLRNAARVICPDVDFGDQFATDDFSTDSGFNSTSNSLTDDALLAIKPATKKKSGGPDYYPMESNPRGLCVIINNVNFDMRPRDTVDRTRYGSDVDAERLRQVFEQLKFIVKQRRNVSSSGLHDLFTEVKEEYRSAMNGHNAFFLFVMSHGDHDVVYGTDNKKIRTDAFVEPFLGESCRELIGKPKVFTFVCCRGGRKDIGYDAVDSMRLYEDVLKAHSTVDGFVSHRNTIEGTYYVSELVKVLAEYACDKHYTKILDMVNIRLCNLKFGSDGVMQTSTYENIAFNKKLYFNPGF